ncbi:hypothetical protein [Ornithinimicrobium sp. Y1694]|uniref:hypothetical protein n=1 Tax=Ornithinimicrobium sp. Y1694 TaxID=3418590 RepID=UPI003CF4CC84
MSDPHLLRALAQALTDPHAFLTVIVEAEDQVAAVRALQERYGWDEHQSAMPCASGWGETPLLICY